MTQHYDLPAIQDVVGGGRACEHEGLWDAYLSTGDARQDQHDEECGAHQIILARILSWISSAISALGSSKTLTEDQLVLSLTPKKQRHVPLKVAGTVHPL